MDYERQMHKRNPFEGLSVKERKYLFVYMRHIVHPNLSIDEIERKWGSVLPKAEYPSVFEALDIVDKIKQETTTPPPSPQLRTQTPPSVQPFSHKEKMVCCIVVCMIVALAIGFYVRAIITEQRHKANATRQLPLIDEEFGQNTITAYKKLLEIEKYSEEARCRRHLCDVFGIGCSRSKNLRLQDCPIRGDCLERAAASEAFCKSLASLQYEDVVGLKLLREECKKVPRLKENDINLLHRIARLWDKDAIRELAESYKNGINVERNDAEAVSWYSNYIDCELNLKELNKLKDLFSPFGKFPNTELFFKVSERLAKYDDVPSLLVLGAKYQHSNPGKSAEYYYRALRKNTTLDAKTMMMCAKFYEQAKQLEKAITFYEGCARTGDLQAILWMGNYWYRRIEFKNNDWYVFGREKLSRRWDKIPYCYDAYSYSRPNEAYKNALYWLEMAASRDDDNTDTFMKLSLLHGAQRRIDETAQSQCIRDLRSALKLGNADAAFELGVIYEKGLGGIVANKAEAKRLYLIAANNGDAQAQLSYAYLLDSPQDAWEWVSKSAKQGNVEAQYQFGRLHDFYGWGAWGNGGWTQLKCSCDYRYGIKQTIVPEYSSNDYRNGAKSWYRSAAKNGHKGAERELAKHGITLE